MQTLFFRAEGGAEMGLGHLIRSGALAKMLSPLFNIHFVINADAPESIKGSFHKEFHLTFADNDETFLNMLQKNDGVVLDGYHYSSALQKNIKDRQAKLICIDDLHDKHFYADLVINQAIDIVEKDYSAENYTKFLFGPHYALLREPFLQKRSTSPNGVETVFICIGGSDYNNNTFSILQLLEEVSPPLTINVVLGASFQYVEKVTTHKKCSKHHIHIYRNLGASEMAAVIAASDIAFVPCSTILLEVLSVGTPAAAGYYTDNQLDIYNSYLKKGLIIDMNDYNLLHQHKEQLFRALERRRFPEAKASVFYFDGGSPRRITKNFLQLFFPEWGRIRKAVPGDVELLFQWVNDPDTRKNAIHQNEIRWEDHVQWFQNRLADAQSHLFIVEFNGIQIGQIRFDLKEKFWDITYAVAPGLRGAGLGELIVSAGIKKIPIADVKGRYFRAFVREHNIASCKIFEKLCFTNKDTVDIEGIPFLQYQYSSEE